MAGRQAEVAELVVNRWVQLVVGAPGDRRDAVFEDGRVRPVRARADAAAGGRTLAPSGTCAPASHRAAGAGPPRAAGVGRGARASTRGRQPWSWPAMTSLHVALAVAILAPLAERGGRSGCSSCWATGVPRSRTVARIVGARPGRSVLAASVVSWRASRACGPAAFAATSSSATGCGSAISSSRRPAAWTASR